MIDIGTRMGNLPAPPPVVLEALTNPTRDPTRKWLRLLEDERLPVIAVEPGTGASVTWSQIWRSRPDARVLFELSADGHGGTEIQWILHVDEPMPDQSKVGHLRKRINELIFANLRYSFGQ